MIRNEKTERQLSQYANSNNNKARSGASQRARRRLSLVGLVLVGTMISSVFLTHNFAVLASLMTRKDREGGGGQEEKDASDMSLPQPTTRIQDRSAITIKQRHTIKQRQKQSFSNGTGLLLNLHITHHAGTSFCSIFKKIFGAPPFVCMGMGIIGKGRKQQNNNASSTSLSPQAIDEWHKAVGFQRHHRPWLHNETSRNIDFIRNKPYNYRMLSWELGRRPNKKTHTGSSLSTTNWEDPNLVSVIIMRDPISRLMSRPCQALFQRFRNSSSLKSPAKKECASNYTHDEWWWYANESRLTNNYALQKLTDYPEQVHGNQTTRKALESAHALIQRFTYVLDIACLDAGMAALADELGINVDQQLAKALERTQSRTRRKTKTHNNNKLKTIPFPDIAEQVQARNALDIELYQWSKRLSLVKCNDTLLKE